MPSSLRVDVGDGFERLAVENRQLRREIETLRRRVGDFERSRWWQLHPRFLLQRLRSLARTSGRRPERTVSDSSARPATLASEEDPRFARFVHEVVERGTFTERWFGKGPAWEAFLQRFDGKRAQVLEVGSFEGLSACYLLWRLPDASITCVDTFAGSPENAGMSDVLARLESTFDANVGLVDASRVRKIVGDSRRVLLDLAAERPLFDIIYVDGSHLALDVLVDAALAWPLLAADGVLVFDDYAWEALGPDPLRRPGPAIDAFLSLIEGKHDVLWRDSQVVLRKTVGGDPRIGP